MSFCFLSILNLLALFAMLRGAASSPVSGAGGSGQRVTDDGRFMKIQWSRSGVQGHTVSQPLVVFLGQTLQFECPEVRGNGVVHELLGQPNMTADLAEICQEIALKLNRSQLADRADCGYQNEIVIKEPNYLPGRIYHFADVPPNCSLCSFVMTIQVRRRGECPFADETECEPKSSTSLTVPSPTATVTPLSSPSISVSVTSSVLLSKSVSLPSPSPSPMTAAVVNTKPSVLILSFLISVVVWLITH